MTDFCAPICLAAKACMLSDQNRTFDGCDLYSKVLSPADPDFLLSFSLQVLSPNSYVRGGEDVNAQTQKGQGNGGGLGLQKSDIIESANRAARNANGARAYFALPLYAVRGLWAIGEMLPNSTRYVVFVIEQPVVFDGPEGPASY